MASTGSTSGTRKISRGPSVTLIRNIKKIREWPRIDPNDLQSMAFLGSYAGRVTTTRSIGSNQLRHDQPLRALTFLPKALLLGHQPCRVWPGNSNLQHELAHLAHKRLIPPYGIPSRD